MERQDLVDTDIAVNSVNSTYSNWLSWKSQSAAESCEDNLWWSRGINRDTTDRRRAARHSQVNALL